jgi:hypothetical protein
MGHCKILDLVEEMYISRCLDEMFVSLKEVEKVPDLYVTIFRSTWVLWCKVSTDVDKLLYVGVKMLSHQDLIF